MNPIISTILWITYFVSLYFAVFWLLVFLENKKPQKTTSLKKFPTVTIAIPAYNEEKTLKSTVESALKLDYPRNKLEFVIINDGSNDKTKKIAETIIKKYKLFNIKLINQKNKGKGAALNAALKIANGKYFVCLDADSFVEKRALKKILPHFTDKRTAAVLPVLKVKQPKNILQKMQWYEYIINMFYKELMSRLNAVHVAPGPFSVYKAEILKKVKGFDENHNLTEDLEMALRLQSKNYKIIQLLDTTVQTIAPNNLKDLYKQRNRWYKGAIFNAIKYKWMMFNKKYGDFGLIQMPTIIISGIIALTIILTILYSAIKPYLIYFSKIKLINFDLLTFITNLRFNFHIFDLNYTTIFVAIAMILITILIIKKSHTHTKEKITKFGVSTLIFYLITYFFVLSIMWIGIAFDIVFKRKHQKW